MAQFKADSVIINFSDYGLNILSDIKI
jgi:hypothetical protein